MSDKMKATPSRTSPKSSKRGCLCNNGTYSTKCCKGNMINHDPLSGISIFSQRTQHSGPENSHLPHVFDLNPSYPKKDLSHLEPSWMYLFGTHTAFCDG